MFNAIKGMYGMVFVLIYFEYVHAGVTLILNGFYIRMFFTSNYRY